MKVRYSYLAEQFAQTDEIFAEMKKLVHSGDFTLGSAVAQFETSFAKLIGTKHAIGVNSGTDALKLSLRAAGIGHGDEVITAANTFIATVGAICELGARPVFVDATPYYTLRVDQVEQAITKKTKAILPVHFTGEPSDMEPLLEIAKKHGLPIIEDACQSILAEYHGQKAGTFGLAAGFSLHPLKNLNVWGDAGVIVTNDDEVNRHLRLLRNHGMKNRDEIEIMGCNSRLDSLQALVGNWLIKDTQKITDKRIENAKTYDRALSELSPVTLAPRRKNVKQVFHLYMFEVAPDIRDALVQHLLREGVDAKVHYPIPLYQQQALKQFGYAPGRFPETDRQARSVVTVPVDQHLSTEQVHYTIGAIYRFFGKNWNA